MIEVDITRDSIDKLGLYASLGVPEIWRFDGAVLSILLLVGESYVEAGRSSAMPVLKRETIEDFVQRSKKLSRTSWLRELRRWVTEHREER